jgi:hypothetical protein
MPRKLEKSCILFSYPVQNAYGATISAGKPDNIATRTTELTLERLRAFDRSTEMLFKKPFEDVHEHSLVTSFCFEDPFFNCYKDLNSLT